MTELYTLIINLDEKLLLFINSLHSSFLDVLMWQISGKFFWLPLYVFLAIFILRNLGYKRGMLCFILIGFLIFSMDQLCASVIRPLVERLRPSSPLNPISELLHFVNDSRGGTYGFPSSHAANSFALASFMVFMFKKRWLSLSMISWAILVSTSRIYLGFHYPTDIIAGALIGVGFAYFFYVFFNLLTSIKVPIRLKQA